MTLISHRDSPLDGNAMHKACIDPARQMWSDSSDENDAWVAVTAGDVGSDDEAESPTKDGNKWILEDFCSENELWMCCQHDNTCVDGSDCACLEKVMTKSLTDCRSIEAIRARALEINTLFSSAGCKKAVPQRSAAKGKAKVTGGDTNPKWRRRRTRGGGEQAWNASPAPRFDAAGTSARRWNGRGSSS
jgi:hypothetical protein